LTNTPDRETTMQAIVQDRYGSADVLEPRDIDRPEIGDGEVLVRVHAASVHIGDVIVMSGSPYLMRVATGLRKPKNQVPGTDIAGTVEAVGKDARGLRPGDDVLGWCTGAFAEYASASEDHFVLKPANLTFEQAALQLLQDEGHVEPGQKVLTNGASGGIPPRLFWSAHSPKSHQLRLLERPISIVSGRAEGWLVVPSLERR
jgi:NADPH:quinone reductase-like Zn-dependent oxidoreductase